MNIRVSAKDVLSLMSASAGENKKSEDKQREAKTEKSEKTYNAKKDALYDKLEKITRDYEKKDTRTYNGTVVPDLKEKTYDAPTDEEITAYVTAEEKSATADKKAKAEKTAADKKAALSAKIDSVNSDVGETEKRINAAYDAAKENASNEALKRGIARSSIVSEQLKELDEGRIEDVENAYENGNRRISAINDEIDKLSSGLTDALNALDIDEAVRINERIVKLKDEREKKQNEVLEYNNALKEKKARLLTQLGGIDPTEENSDEFVNARAEKFRALYDYYRKSADAATETAEDKNRIEKYVGNDGYEYLRRMLGL